MTTILPILMTALLILAVIGVWCLVQLPIRSARTLRHRCSGELKHLLTLLTNRHLILSHLLDLMPRSDVGLVNPRKLQRRLRQAEKVMKTIDSSNPIPASLRSVEELEQSLMAGVYDLKLGLEALDTDGLLQAVDGCLEGLEKVSQEIRDSASTYNAAAITYSTFVDGSILARRMFPRDFEILDLEPQISSISDDSSSRGDRVAS